MEQAIEAKFSCGGCGRMFRWKPAIAGKKAKCACGTSVTVPTSAPGATKSIPRVAITLTPKKVVPTTNVVKKVSPPPVVPVQKVSTPAPAVQSSDDDYGEYGLADGDISQLGSLLPSAEAIAAAEREVPPILASKSSVPVALEYDRSLKNARTMRAERVEQIDPTTGELSDPFRDFIIPAILLAAGLVGVAVYMIQKMGTGPLVGLAISIAFGVMLAVTMVKTVVLTMAAMPLAGYCDVSLGLLRTAILKLAGTILFGDIAILWLIVAMQSAGMIPKNNDGGPEAWLIYVVALAVIYHLCFWYLFRLSAGDVGFASLMSFVSRLCNFFMTLMVIALIESIVASHAQPTAANVPARLAPITIAPATPMTVQPGQNSPTVMDQLISQDIKRNSFGMQEGYAWCQSRAADDADKKLVSDLYGAGADKVYVNGFILYYAVLPGDPAKRTACLSVAQAFRSNNGMPDNSALNYQYAVINLLGERMKGMHHGN